MSKIWILQEVTSERCNSDQYPFVMKKVFNWSELHLSEVTSYKIHTLITVIFVKILRSDKIEIIFSRRRFLQKMNKGIQFYYYETFCSLFFGRN